MLFLPNMKKAQSVKTTASTPQPIIVIWNTRWPCLWTPVCLAMVLFLWDFPLLSFFALLCSCFSFFLLSFSFLFTFSACLFSLSLSFGATPSKCNFFLLFAFSPHFFLFFSFPPFTLSIVFLFASEYLFLHSTFAIFLHSSIFVYLWILTHPISWNRYFLSFSFSFGRTVNGLHE